MYQLQNIGYSYLLHDTSKYTEATLVVKAATENHLQFPVGSISMQFI